MLQCSDCEFCQSGPEGELVFTCDPFLNIKEPECLVKWQLLKLNSILEHHEQTHEMQQRLAPLQERMIQYMEREIEEQEEAESWKQCFEDHEDPEDTH